MQTGTATTQQHASSEHDEPSSLMLPAVPQEVVVEFMMPHAFDTMRDAVNLMLVCRAAHLAATTKRGFWEVFLWRRFHSRVLPWLESAYGKHAGPLVDLLLSKYVMWPPSIELESTYGDGGVMAVVRSKFFVAQQVPDLWGDLHPICCSLCDHIQSSPWWRCMECPSNPVICAGCRKSDLEHCSEHQDDQQNSESGANVPPGVNAEDTQQEHNDHPEPPSVLPSQEVKTADEAEENGATQKADEENVAQKHKPNHELQLVVEPPYCDRCDEQLHNSWWCCKLCLNFHILHTICETCRTLELESPTGICYAPENKDDVRSDKTRHLWSKFTEGVDFINRWSTEAPHPPLTFNQAWTEGIPKKEYTPLYLLKLYSPTFLDYGCYVCWLQNRPCLMEGWIFLGSIQYGIKYTGWKHTSHIFEGKFEDSLEGFPDGPGTMQWSCGLKFIGNVHMHNLVGDKCSLEMIDGSRYEGSLLNGETMFTTQGKGVLTFADGRQIECAAETGHGRRLDEIRFWTDGNQMIGDKQERFVLSTRRGILEPVDQFADDIAGSTRGYSESSDDPEPRPPSSETVSPEHKENEEDAEAEDEQASRTV